MRIQTEDPPSYQERVQMIQAFADNPHLVWVRGDETIGVLANTLESVNVSGFGTDSIPVSEHGREKEMFTVYVSDPEGEISPKNPSLPSAQGLNLTIVGRDRWSLGVALDAGESFMLLDVLDVPDAETVRDVLDDEGEVGFCLRPYEIANKVALRDGNRKDVIGSQIDPETVFNEMGQVDMQIV